MAMAAWSRPDDPTIHGMIEVEVSRALAYLESEREKSGVHVTVTHLVARAVAYALSKVPDANVQIRWGRVVPRSSINIFLQVVSEDGRDLSGTLGQGCSILSLARSSAGVAAA